MVRGATEVTAFGRVCVGVKLSKWVASVSCRSASGGAAVRALGLIFAKVAN